MKNSLSFITLSVVLFFFSSCSQEDVLREERPPGSKQEAFRELEKRIENLNARFAMKTNVPKSKNFGYLYDLLDEMGLLLVETGIPFYPESWNCADVDATAYETARDRYNENQSKEMSRQASAACEKEQQKAEAVVGRGYDLDPRGFKIYYPDRIDPVRPVNDVSLWMPITHPAYEVGIEHNHVIRYLSSYDPWFMFEDDSYEISRKLSEASADIGYPASGMHDVDVADYVSELMPDMMLPISEEKYSYLIDKYNLGDEGYILSLYMLNVTQMSGARAVEYSREFAQVIEEFYEIPEESRHQMIGTISTAINSRFLWNMQLPNPLETNLFISYRPKRGEEEEDRWNLVTTAELIKELEDDDARLWGIPKFNEDGELSAVIFYRNYDDYIPFDHSVFDYLLVDRVGYSFDYPYEIYNSNTVSTPYISDVVLIPPITAPIYQLEFDENIYIISFEQ